MAQIKMPKTVLLGIDNFLTFHKTYKNQPYGKCKKVIRGPIEHPRLSFSTANKAIPTA